MQKDILIAVMGLTGAGKSSFIKRVTGRSDVKVGHSLESATEEVTPYSFSYGGYNFTLIDTPGFDDSRFSDDVIVNKLLEWLRDTARRDQKLNGIIYMHRITDSRIQGSARASMSMFRRLCGKDYFANVVLATTFWNNIDVSLGARRERELRENDEFWGLLAKKGSKVCRVGLSIREDHKLLLRIAQNKKALVGAQIQMQAGLDPSGTSAAKGVNKDLANLAKEFDQRLQLERARHQQELQELDQRRKYQYDAQKAAIEEEQRKMQAEDLRIREQEKTAWEARRHARKAEQEKQSKELKAQYKEMIRQKELEEQRQRRLEAELRARAKCSRPPASEKITTSAIAVGLGVKMLATV